ncbi:uncharacterized protein [Tenebrio molitor]|jgi:hypothetical protein|uniref:uncharacterized protein isoform X2 n=1 Tax=Tenebrio molitor TaxID=7067 RepID=UPI003624A819
MSAIDTSCYAVPPEKESGAGEMNRFKPPPCGSSSSHLIASEIMNDILDNAFEVIMAKNLQPVPKVEKISPNVVGDILENILSPTPNSGVSNENYRHDETVLLDDEIKRIIKEMKYPPEQKSIICTQAEPVKRNTLERKNRLTNLVRNSKQMLAKFVTNDNENELRMAKSEEVHERLLKVIDLEGDDHSNFAEPGSSSDTGILQMPPEAVMDMVDLEPNIHKEGDVEIEKIDKEMAGCSITKMENTKCVNVNKKKWNIGAKIMKYIKRNKDTKKE